MSPLDRQIAQRDAALHALMADEIPARLMTVCSWCPDAREKTAEAHAQGFQVTHSICQSCIPKFTGEGA